MPQLPQRFGNATTEVVVVQHRHETLSSKEILIVCVGIEGCKVSADAIVGDIHGSKVVTFRQQLRNCARKLVPRQLKHTD